MYCGSCNNYIPSGLEIIQCPHCGCSVEESRKLAEEREQKKAAEEMSRARELQKSEKTYNYFQAAYCSFFSKNFYLNVIRKWKGFGVGYAVFIIGLGLVPFALGINRTLLKEVDLKVIPVLKNLPTFTFSNGLLSINQQSPYVIRNPANQEIWALIDTKGSYTDLTDIPALLLLTQNQMAFRENVGNVRVIRFDSQINFIITPEQISYGVTQFIRWLPYALFPILWVCYVIGIFCLAFCYALAGMLIARFLKCGLSFQELIRLSLAALTPMVLLDGVISFWKRDGLWDPIAYTLPVLYLIAALWFYHAARKESAAC